MHLKPIMRVGGYFEAGFYLFISTGRVLANVSALCGERDFYFFVRLRVVGGVGKFSMRRFNK